MLKIVWRDIVAPRLAHRVADILRPEIQTMIRREDSGSGPAPAAPAMAPAMADAPSALQIYKGYDDADLTLFGQFHVPDRRPEKGFIIDFLGGRTRTSSLFDAVASYDTQVQGLPIPHDYHAEAVEWLGLLKTAKTAEGRYVAMEWGAGWAPWLIAGALAARRLGVIENRLYGVEADPEHFAAMRRHFLDNHLPPERHVLLQAAVGAVAGAARWPNHDSPQNLWDYRPVRDGSIEDDDYLNGRVNEFTDVDILPARDLLLREPLWDMVHIDIQGWEGEVCRSCIDVLSERVKWVIIGVHSRILDAELLQIFYGAGWFLEHEKPTRWHFVPGKVTFEAMVLADGTQVWRNPRLVPDRQTV